MQNTVHLCQKTIDTSIVQGPVVLALTMIIISWLNNGVFTDQAKHYDSKSQRSPFDSVSRGL